MRTLLWVVVVFAAGFLLREHFQQRKEREMARLELAKPAADLADVADLAPEREDFAAGSRTENVSGLSCDGRKRCSQMHSCEEATWFINNCPDMEMDGDGDGVPCERQWCER